MHERDMRMMDAAPTKATVGILNLQVVLAREGNGWVAQGIEIDYAACGASKDDVKERFESGLCATIQAHLDRFGDVDQLLTPTPVETWRRLLPAEEQMRYSHVSQHQFFPPVFFPFGKIMYMIPPDKVDQPRQVVN